MAQLFGHERLGVYRKGMEFAAIRKSLLDALSRRVAACDHLDRGAESILNTAEGNGRFTGTDQVKFLGIAYKATVQSASLVQWSAAPALTPTPHRTAPSMTHGKKPFLMSSSRVGSPTYNSAFHVGFRPGQQASNSTRWLLSQIEYEG